MLLGELTTFKHYRKKNPILARQIDTKFIVTNVAPKKTLTGEPGDYLVIDDEGNQSIAKKDEFEAVNEEIT